MKKSGKEMSNFFIPPSSCSPDPSSGLDPDQTQKQHLNPQVTRFIRGHALTCHLLQRKRLVGIGGEQGCVGLDCGDRLELPTLVMFSQARTLGGHTPESLS